MQRTTRNRGYAFMRCWSHAVATASLLTSSSSSAVSRATRSCCPPTIGVRSVCCSCPLYTSRRCFATPPAPPFASSHSGDRDAITKAKAKKRQRSAKRPYKFPVTRAAEHIRHGYRYHQTRPLYDTAAAPSPAGNADTIARASSAEAADTKESVTPARRTRASTFSVFLEDMWEYLGQAREDTDNEAELAATVTTTRTTSMQTAPEEEERQVSAFLQYHCHHLYVHFKQQRKSWSASQNTDSHAQAERFSQLASNTLHAAMLLHLSALYGLADDRVEALLEVCFSSSIVLSQTLNTHRHRHATQQNRRRRHDVEASLYASSHEPHWRCLMRAVFHYAEGVRLWQLCLTEAELFPSRNASAVFGKLLQAHAGSLLDSCARAHVRLAPLPRQHLAALLSGQRRQEVTHALTHWFGAGTCVSQRRSLQLLPLLWLSTSVTALTYKQDDRVSPILSLREPWQLSWRTARFSFVQLLGLFDGEAPTELTTHVLGEVLYTQSDHGTTTLTARQMNTAPDASELATMLSALASHGPAVPTDTASYAEHILQRWLLVHARDTAHLKQLRTGSNQLALRTLWSGCPTQFRSLGEALGAISRLPVLCVALAIRGRDSNEDTAANHVSRTETRSAQMCVEAQATNLVRALVMSVCVRWCAWRLPPALLTAADGMSVPASLVLSALVSLQRTATSGAAAAHHVCDLLHRTRQRQDVLQQSVEALVTQCDAHHNHRVALESVPSSSPLDISQVVRVRRRSLEANAARVESVRRWLECEATLLRHAHTQLEQGLAELITVQQRLPTPDWQMTGAFDALSDAARAQLDAMRAQLDKASR